MKNFHGIKSMIVFLSLSLTIPQLFSQDTIILKTYECAIVKFHLFDDCPCSHIELERRAGFSRSDNVFRVIIDSVVQMHVANDFIDKQYLIDSIFFMSVPDTIDLQIDTFYYASIGIDFNYNNVMLNYLSNTKTVYLENRNAPIQAGFACECEMGLSLDCLKNKALILKSVNECKERSNRKTY